MSRSINDLTDEVKELAEETVSLCSSRGVDLVIYSTLRTLEDQARLYRQSRTRSQILSKQQKIRNRGFGFLADIIDKVGPQSGKKATNAAPGESFHNYGLAFDAAPVVNGKILWRTIDDPSTLDIDEGKIWQIYGKSSTDAGLNWSGYWTSFKEYAHSQLGKGSNPLKRYTPDQIKIMLQSQGLL